MNTIYSAVASIAVAILTYLLQSKIKEIKSLKQEKEEIERTKEKALEDGVLCLLRVKLIEYHEKYMSAGEISSHGFENWSLMYKAYHGLGGNGMVEHMKEDIEDLHIRVGNGGRQW